jgi:hypothetical protein
MVVIITIRKRGLQKLGTFDEKACGPIDNMGRQDVASLYVNKTGSTAMTVASAR